MLHKQIVECFAKKCLLRDARFLAQRCRSSAPAREGKRPCAGYRRTAAFAHDAAAVEELEMSVRIVCECFGVDELRSPNDNEISGVSDSPSE